MVMAGLAKGALSGKGKTKLISSVAAAVFRPSKNMTRLQSKLLLSTRFYIHLLELVAQNNLFFVVISIIHAGLLKGWTSKPKPQTKLSDEHSIEPVAKKPRGGRD